MSLTTKKDEKAQNLISSLMHLVSIYGLKEVIVAIHKIYKDRFCDACGHLKEMV